MINHLSLLAIANASDLSEVVVLSNIMDGVDGAATMYYSHEATGNVQIEAKDTIITKLAHTIEAQVLWSSSDATQLNTWRDAQTRVICAGYGIDGGLVWLTPSLISNTQKFDNIHSMGVRITQDTLPGFTDGERDIHVGENLLGLFNVLSGSGSYLYGFSGTGGSRSGSNQTVAVGTINSQAILFPFVGKTITFGVNCTARSGTNSMILRALDDAGSEIDTTTVSIGATGDFTGTHTLPALTASVQLRFTSAAASSMTVNSPYIRVLGTRFTLE